MQFLIAVLIALIFLAAAEILRLRVKIGKLRTQGSSHPSGNSSQDKPEAVTNLEEDTEHADDDLKDQAQKVEKVYIFCRSAELHLVNLNDVNERKSLVEKIEKAVEIALDINDPFYFGASLHPIIVLAHKAGLNEKKDELLAMVTDPFVKEEVMEEINTRF